MAASIASGNETVTVTGAETTSWQCAPLPKQPVDHVGNEPLASSETAEPFATVNVHVPAVHGLVPSGVVICTVPPSPGSAGTAGFRFTSVTSDEPAATALSRNTAVTCCVAVRVTAQAAVPEQPPAQPANVEPASATAFSVTAAPCERETEQVAPQSIVPAGSLTTWPPPERITSSRTSGGSFAGPGANPAATASGPFATSRQPAAVPTHAPPHESRWPPVSAVAVSVSAVPRASASVHTPRQAEPPVEAATAPSPEVVIVTVTVLAPT